jgi:hypothetical protein
LPASPQRRIVHPPRASTQDEPQEQHVDLFWVVILVIAVLFIGTIVWLLVDKFAGSLL